MTFYYKIKTKKALYNLVEENGSIYIGGDMFYCTEISTGYLYYDKDVHSCFITKSDDWDSADMLNAIFYFYNEKYKGICKFKLQDVSSNTYWGDLSSYYLAFYQQTMYEKKFNAYIEDPYINEKYLKHKEIFNKKQISIKTFSDFLDGYKIEYKDILLELYNESNTIKEFFDKLKQKYSNLKDSIPLLSEKMIKPWLDKFIKNILYFGIIENQYWIIECKNNSSLLDFSEYSIIEVKKDDSLPKFKGHFMNIKKKIHYLRQMNLI